MSESDDIESLAGEFVLGTLAPKERAAAAARRAVDPRLDEAIARWELRFAPLSDNVEEISPSAQVFERIKAAIAHQPNNRPDEAMIARLTGRIQRWRAAAIVATAAAIMLAALNAFSNKFHPEPARFVALLQKGETSPAFVIDVDVQRRLLTVRRVAAQPTPGKSYELWMIQDKLGAPKSLGVVADSGFTVRSSLSEDPAVIKSATYAVTLEQAGGSPNGAPSGPPLWTATLVQATP